MSLRYDLGERYMRSRVGEMGAVTHHREAAACFWAIELGSESILIKGKIPPDHHRAGAQGRRTAHKAASRER